MIIDKEKEEEEIILDTDISDEEESPEQEITVDLEEEEEEEEKPGNKAFAEMRIENKELKDTVETLTRSVDDLKNKPDPVIQQAPVVDDKTDPRRWTEDQWDQLAKSDWKRAVDLRSKIQAEDRISTDRNRSEFDRVMSDSQITVLKRHPELNDPNSEKTKVYRNIVTANPEYTTQKKGPITAMYEMEEYMEKTMGYKREDIIKAELSGRQQEIDRQNRVSITSTSGHNITEGNKVTITKDEMDFCKLQGIDPKLYATNKKKLAMAGKGGVQL